MLEENQTYSYTYVSLVTPCFPSGKFGHLVANPKLWFVYNSTIGGRKHESEEEVTPELKDKYPYDSDMGYGAVEIRLTEILSSSQ